MRGAEMASLPSLVQWGINIHMLALVAIQSLALSTYARRQDAGCLWIAAAATFSGLLGAALILIGGLL